MDWKDVLGVIVDKAPAAGAIFAPVTGGASVLAGMAIKHIANAFGIKSPDPKPEEIMAAIQADPQAAMKLEQARMAMTHELALKQIEAETKSRSEQAEINLQNAKDMRFWNSGWRPALGWVCASSLFVYYVPKALMGTIMWVVAIVAADYQLVAYPDTLDTGEILGLVATLLGVSGLKSVEKIKGVAK